MAAGHFAGEEIKMAELTKKEIRREIRALRDGMSDEKRSEISHRIMELLIDEFDPDEYDTFLFYYPLGSEVSLLPLASQMLSLGKTVAFPRVNGETMDFYQVSNLTSDFAEGVFHVMEPQTDKQPDLSRAICFVPGLMYDRKGFRLGYGKGYYDKYFAAHPEIHRTGICPNRFFMPELPAEATDIAMHDLITENRVYEFNQSEY